MSGKMFPTGSRARLLDGSEVEILDCFEDEQQYRVRILTGPAISLVRRGRVLRVRVITVPAENVEPLIAPPHLTGLDALFAAPAWRRC
ncbi:MAG TPA: hypothetical protein PLA39_03635 [Methanoculleus sp.]|jgi:hypothetical protein|nr:hypothetical protein [Methanoculleus sp.]